MPGSAVGDREAPEPPCPGVSGQSPPVAPTAPLPPGAAPTLEPRAASRGNSPAEGMENGVNKAQVGEESWGGRELQTEAQGSYQVRKTNK